jgi:hypothetical protein
LYDSFIRYNMPVYPGAPRETLLAETHVAGLSPIWTLAPMIVPNPAF